MITNVARSQYWIKKKKKKTPVWDMWKIIRNHHGILSKICMVFSSSGILSTNFTQYATGWKYIDAFFKLVTFQNWLELFFTWIAIENLHISSAFSFFRANFCTMKTKKNWKILESFVFKSVNQKKNCHKVENFLQTLENDKTV